MTARLKMTAIAVLGMVGVAARPALTCGFEDPGSIPLQQAALNVSHPDALYVLGALDQAQSKGLVPRDPAGSAGLLAGLVKTASLLRRFGEELETRSSPTDSFTFSLVLIEPMLWTRYVVRNGRVETTIHIDGPFAGEPVVVTTATALRQIVAERTSLPQAEALGLVRLYGDGLEAHLLGREKSL